MLRFKLKPERRGDSTTVTNYYAIRRTYEPMYICATELHELFEFDDVPVDLCVSHTKPAGQAYYKAGVEVNGLYPYLVLLDVKPRERIFIDGSVRRFMERMGDKPVYFWVEHD